MTPRKPLPSDGPPAPADGEPNAASSVTDGPRSRARRILLVLLAILVPQCVLFGPSIVGAKVLLPLDVLTTGVFWIGEGEPERREVAQDRFLSDLVMVTELNRRFAVEEVRAGRWPLWNPHIYCGAPFLASNHPAVFSPYRLVDYLWPGFEAIAWGQVLKALVAGIGSYVFLRRALGAGFLGGLAAAALFPLCGYMILWSGFTLANVASFLPWLLLATDATVKRPIGPGVVLVALVSAAILVSGHAANAGHLFVAAGLFALFRAHENGGLARASGVRALVAVGLGFVLGFALSAPQLLPTLEYMQGSSRIAARAAGHAEVAPMGWHAFLQLLLPYTLGSGERDALALSPVTRFEGAAAGHAGLVATLVLAPLAFAVRERRRTALFFALLAAFALVPLLGVPLLKSIFELPPLNVLRNNRFTVATAFGLVVLAALGIDALARGAVRPRSWQWAGLGLSALLVLYGVLRLVWPPVDDAAPNVAAWFLRYDVLGLAVALAGSGAWFAVRRLGTRSALPVLAIAALELVVNAWGVNPQCERALYYPKLPVLEEIARRGGGRMIGIDCLPPNLAQAAGLSDVRGYDAADPIRSVELLLASREPGVEGEVDYARTLFHVPTNPSGISDLLGLRWIVLRGSPPEGASALVTTHGYSLQENRRALPRAFVPTRVETIPGRDERLARLAARDFDPRAVAFVETDLAERFRGPAAGTARIAREVPTEVEIELDLQTDGLIVLADSHDAGWRAEVDGEPREVLVANHALRGVCVERGARRLVFRYWPRTLTIGFWIAGAAVVILCGWTAWTRKRPST